MLIRKLRLKRGWTQSQVAEMAGVTIRTIQRIEKGHPPSLETRKALASVFEVDLSSLQPEDTTVTTLPESKTHTEANPNDNQLQADEQAALLYAKRMKEFYEFLFTYLVLAAVFFTVFPIMFPDSTTLLYVIFGALGVAGIFQGLIAFEVISFLKPEWERKIAEKKLGRKL